MQCVSFPWLPLEVALSVLNLSCSKNKFRRNNKKQRILPLIVNHKLYKNLLSLKYPFGSSVEHDVSDISDFKSVKNIKKMSSKISRSKHLAIETWMES